MKLKKKKQSVFIVESDDFDKFVKSIYGGNYEFVAYQEAQNYSCYKFEAPNMNMPWPKDDENVRKGKYKVHDTHRLFRCLFEDGHIEEGTYIINVSW